MDRTYTDIMVDIETTGLRPTCSAIIQIGAVPFNYDTMKIDTNNMFKASMVMPPNRYWTDNTQDFWLRQNREVYDKIISEARRHTEVMEKFYAYCNERSSMRFWCKGLSFEWPFLVSYFELINKEMPFAFWNAKDLRSFGAGLMGSAHWENPWVEPVGDAHDALSDCLTQIKQLAYCKEVADALPADR